MLEAELRELLKQTGLPVFYNQTDGNTILPYIVYTETNGSAYGSDFRNEIRRVKYLIELYSVRKDRVNQEKLETLLDKQGIEYDYTEGRIDTESMYLAAYYIDFIRKGRC